MSLDPSKSRVIVRVQAEPFDIAAEIAALSASRTDIGAITTFTGLCRDEGGLLAALEIEHYPGMVDQEIRRVVDDALERWPLQAITVVHRFGRITPGEQIVLVATASWHRSESFCAAEFLMDYMKTEAPFWKRQHLADGTSGGWVTAKDTDFKALEKWKRDAVREEDLAEKIDTLDAGHIAD